jgi:hypothetical protein
MGSVIGLCGDGDKFLYRSKLGEGQVGRRFSAPVQTGPGTHPASYTKGTGSFPGVKQLGRGIDHPRQG